MVIVVDAEHIVPDEPAVDADERRHFVDFIEVIAECEVDAAIDSRFKRDGVESGGESDGDFCFVDFRDEGIAL